MGILIEGVTNLKRNLEQIMERKYVDEDAERNPTPKKSRTNNPPPDRSLGKISQRKKS